MTIDLDKLESALDALLTAMIADEATWPKPPIKPRCVLPIGIPDPIPSRAEVEMAQLLRHPVYFVLRQAVRRLGEEVFESVGTTGSMRDVLERVASRRPREAAQRGSMMDVAWNGLGSDSDRWWS